MSAGDATAAAAAAQAAQAVLDTSESYRRSDVLRTLIQKPDIFRPETREQEVEQWSEWKHTMRNYLSVVDSKMLDDMETIEAVPARASTIKGMEPAAWRVLVGEMQPATRQRQLALMAQLAGVRFDANRSMAEQIVKYEELIKEYERVISSIIQASPATLREKLALNQSGPTDMEIDRVEKGKGGPKAKPGGPKGKEKERAKTRADQKRWKEQPGWWLLQLWWAALRPRLPQRERKGKHVNQVNQVNQEQAAATTTATPTSSSPPRAAPTTRTTTTSQPPTNSVRRVQQVTPPDASTTYVFDISDNDAVTDFYDDFPEELAIRAVRARSPRRGNDEPGRPGERHQDALCHGRDPPHPRPWFDATLEPRCFAPTPAGGLENRAPGSPFHAPWSSFHAPAPVAGIAMAASNRAQGT
eukprot:s148_g12.t1